MTKRCKTTGRTLPRQSRQIFSWYLRCASSSATKSSSRSRKSAPRCSSGRLSQYSQSACRNLYFYKSQRRSIQFHALLLL